MAESTPKNQTPAPQNPTNKPENPTTATKNSTKAQENPIQTQSNPGTQQKVEETYDNLKSNKKNNVENLMQWLKGSALVAQALRAEERARELFEDCVDKNDVELQKFQQVVSTLAIEQDKNVEDLTRILAEQVPPVAAALDATDKGLKDAIQK